MKSHKILIITVCYNGCNRYLAATALLILVLLSSTAAASQPAVWQTCIHNPESFLEYLPDAKCFPTQYKSAVERLRREPPFTFAAGQSAVKVDGLEKHISLVENSLKSTSRGTHDKTHFLIGLLYEKQGNLKKAEQNYSLALSIRQNSPLVLYRLASVCRKQKQFDRSVQYLKELHWRSPHLSSQVLFSLGDTLHAAGKSSLALPYLRSASMSPDPTAVDARRALVEIQQRLISIEQDPARQAALRAALLADLQGILYQTPGDRDAAITFGRMLLETSDPLVHAGSVAMAEQLSRGVVDRSNYSDTEAVRLLFDTLLKKRDLEQAEQVIEKALEADPKAPLLLEAQSQLALERRAAAINGEKTEAP